jgi:hypothetical protein
MRSEFKSRVYWSRIIGRRAVLLSLHQYDCHGNNMTSTVSPALTAPHFHVADSAVASKSTNADKPESFDDDLSLSVRRLGSGRCILVGATVWKSWVDIDSQNSRFRGEQSSMACDEQSGTSREEGKKEERERRKEEEGGGGKRRGEGGGGVS